MAEEQPHVAATSVRKAMSWQAAHAVIDMPSTGREPDPSPKRLLSLLICHNDFFLSFLRRRSLTKLS